ncbi:fibronectin type III domain-containing protein 7-like [Osmerus eperlanus]|uniref:fibronectin type III domain-containing protein 7-like n=1 Tax=Osmerus eperlanus TaxID=29151 RepID=UPI002E149C95
MAPCSLSSITAFAQCHNSSIQVEWQRLSAGLRNPVYTATAEGSDHSFLYCNSSSSSCVLQEAHCGLQYSVIVAPSSDKCSRLRSAPYRISMEPCPPQDVVINSSCELRGALVSWAASTVAEAYRVTAAGAGGDVRTCNSTAANCSLADLSCGQTYAVSVVASHQNCSSTPSQNISFNTAPCQPSSLSVTLQCSNQSAELSWAAAPGAVAYYGRAQPGNGTSLFCAAAGTSSCSFVGLQCGAEYNFSVQASDGTCNSSFSASLLDGAAPCPPDQLKVWMTTMQGLLHVLRASWAQVSCPGTEYLLEVRGSIQGDLLSQFHLASYWSSSTYFEMPLPCGSAYNATVTSRSAAGTSSPSGAVTGTTAPCPPPYVSYHGDNSSALVAWNASVYASMYTVYDVRAAVRLSVCSTPLLSCPVTDLNPGDLEVTASNTAGESPPTQNITVLSADRRRKRDVRDEEPQMAGGRLVPTVRVSVETSTTLLVDWSSVPGAETYTLVVREQGVSGRPQVLTVYGESSILTDLRPASTYCVSVSAWGPAAPGPYSQPVCVELSPGVRM